MFASVFCLGVGLLMHLYSDDFQRVFQSTLVASRCAQRSRFQTKPIPLTLTGAHRIMDGTHMDVCMLA